MRYVEALNRARGAAFIGYPLPRITAGNIGNARQFADNLEHRNTSIFHTFFNAENAHKSAKLRLVAAISFSECFTHAFTSQKGLGVE